MHIGKKCHTRGQPQDHHRLADILSSVQVLTRCHWNNVVQLEYAKSEKLNGSNLNKWPKTLNLELANQQIFLLKIGLRPFFGLIKEFKGRTLFHLTISQLNAKIRKCWNQRLALCKSQRNPMVSYWENLNGLTD